jgi:hypothetical protein
VRQTYYVHGVAAVATDFPGMDLEMAKTRKQEAITQAIEDINPLKSRLMGVYNDLMSAGAEREARSLDTIIARLEGWQAARLGR